MGTKQNLSTGSSALVIFLVSFSALTLELSLTRIYSFLLWYHFVFAVVAIAVLGTSAGSWYVHRRAETEDRWPELKPLLYWLSLSSGGALAVLLIGSLQAFWPLVILIPVVPFFFVGQILTTLFSHKGSASPRLYFADLSGAALGAILAPVMLNGFGPVQTILLVSALPLLVAAWGKAWRAKFAVGLLAIVTIFGLNQAYRLEQYLVAPGKSMQSAVAMDGMNQRQFFDWGAFSRTDVFGTAESEFWVIYADGGAGTRLYRFDGDLDSVKQLRSDINFMPFLVREKAKTLVIGPGGGREVLMALLGGSTDITAVEVNPSMYEVPRRFPEYAGNVYDRREVRAIIADGRGFVERDSAKYDVIYLPLVFSQAAETQGYALAENYVFTREAFSGYQERLSDTGLLALRVHDNGELLRVVTTWLSVQQDKGVSVPQALDGVAIFADLAHVHGGDYTMPLVLLKKEEFTQAELSAMAAFAHDNRHGALYLPNVYEGGPLSPLKNGQASVEDLVKSASYDIRPVTDDRPFFYQTDRALPRALVAVLFGILGLIAGLIVRVLGSREARRKKAVHFHTSHFSVALS